MTSRFEQRLEIPAKGRNRRTARMQYRHRWVLTFSDEAKGDVYWAELVVAKRCSNASCSRKGNACAGGERSECLVGHSIMRLFRP